MSPDREADDPLLSPSEAGDLIGRHAETIRNWIKEEGLEARKVRGRSPSGYEYRVRQSDLLDFIRVEAD